MRGYPTLIHITIRACLLVTAAFAQTFEPIEKTIPELRAAIDSGAMTCRQLTQWYLDRIEAYNKRGPTLNAIRELNPNALRIADEYDRARTGGGPRGPLYCIPILLKDNINTFDMPTTAGSVALRNSIPPDDAFLTKRLKAAGAIILGKANLTEFANYITNGMPSGYSSLGGYVFDPYDPRPQPAGDGRPALNPSGSSSGSAVAAAANLAAATVGTETSGSILSPASVNSVVGIKPTVGLISREGVIPIAASQDTAGPLTRTVTDAAILLGAMTGVDPKDAATAASEGKALADYTPHLRPDALNGARIGVPRVPYWNNLSVEQRAISENALNGMRRLGATVIDVEITTAAALNAFSSSVLRYEFKRDLNAYLSTLGPNAPVKTLADIVSYNEAHRDVALKYGQTLAIASQATDLEAARPRYLSDLAEDLRLAKTEGLDPTIDRNNLSAVFFPGSSGAGIGAKAGYPSIILPAGYLTSGAPYGVTLLNKAFGEASLIGLAYSFEQGAKIRRSPSSAWPVLPLNAQVSAVSVRNLASGNAGAVAPGEFVVVSGSGIGPTTPAVMRFTSEGRVDTEVDGTRLLFDGVPAPLISVKSDEIVAIVPYAVAGKNSVMMHVEQRGRRSAALRLEAADAVPGIFAGVLNQDGTRNSPTNPAAKGSIITFYATGEGRPGTLGIDGRIGAAPLQTPFLPVVVGVNHAGVQVLYAGAAPRFPSGLMQVNARLDPGTPSGSAIAVVLQVGQAFSQTITVAVQ